MVQVLDGTVEHFFNIGRRVAEKKFLVNKFAATLVGDSCQSTQVMQPMPGAKELNLVCVALQCMRVGLRVLLALANACILVYTCWYTNVHASMLSLRALV